MAFVAFDVEIAKPVPDGADILIHRPGIACAALAREGDARASILFDPSASPEWFDAQTRTMTREGALRILTALEDAVGRGETLVTWNGAGFDFRLLADETGRHADCVRLAMASVDMMFQGRAARARTGVGKAPGPTMTVGTRVTTWFRLLHENSCRITKRPAARRHPMPQTETSPDTKDCEPLP